MGFKGYDWKESNDVFEGAARFSRGGMLNYHPLVVVARQQGKKGHELLREMGTTGIQTPIRLVDGQLVGTKRLHDTTLELGPPQGPTVHPKWLTHFDTHSGKAVLNKSPWEWFSDPTSVSSLGATSSGLPTVGSTRCGSLPSTT